MTCVATCFGLCSDLVDRCKGHRLPLLAGDGVDSILMLCRLLAWFNSALKMPLAPENVVDFEQNSNHEFMVWMPELSVFIFYVSHFYRYLMLELATGLL